MLSDAGASDLCVGVSLYQLVIDWLEQSAADQLENFYNKVDFSSDRMGAW